MYIIKALSISRTHMQVIPLQADWTIPEMFAVPDGIRRREKSLLM